MVDPLDPRSAMPPKASNDPDTPLNDPLLDPLDPSLNRRTGSNAYMLGTVLIVAIIIIGYFFYSNGTTTTSPPPPAASDVPATTPAPSSN